MNYSLFHHCFEQAEQSPDKLAIAGSDRDISWQELKKEVEALCGLFARLDIPKGAPVILCGHKETFMAVAMLACLHYELPYIPVDRSVPVERAERIRMLSAAQILIGDSSSWQNEFAVQVASDLSSVKQSDTAEAYTTYYNERDPLCYVMFTSGTTGDPKGVQITREAVFSFVAWMRQDFGFRPGEVYINQALLNFDLSVYEVLATFFFGGTLLLNSKEVSKNGAHFLERVKKYNGTVWVSTPSFAYLYLMQDSFQEQQLPSLRYFLFCGEELPHRTAAKLKQLFPVSRVVNTFGPTEATVSTTFVEITEEILAKYPVLPVGYPKFTSEILICNDTGNKEEQGEIVIVGENVSIGYLKNEELTREKFYRYNDQRAYRTGDFGYFKDGMLFFAGRQDEQVKLNGYRIELGDIRANINLMPGIKETVVIPLKKDQAVKRIIAFVQMEQPPSESEIFHKQEQIKNWLKGRLPEYMIPSEIIPIEQFPTNANHKIDKVALLEAYLNPKN